MDLVIFLTRKQLKWVSLKAERTDLAFASGKGKMEMTDGGASLFSSSLPKQHLCWRTLKLVSPAHTSAVVDKWRNTLLDEFGLLAGF